MIIPTNGLTDPYTGGQACSRLFVHGHTFRWVKGDSYIAVMKGNCLDLRRLLIIEDHFVGQHVYETPQPVIAAIPAPHQDWADSRLLRRIADAWAAEHAVPRTAQPQRGR